MSDDQRTVRLVQTWLESEAPSQLPIGLIDRIASTTRSSRPRPAWIARLEGHHMDVIEGGRRSGAPTLGLIVAVVVIAIAALAGAAFVGSRLVQPPVAPTPSQRAVLTVPSAAPASSAKAPASTPAVPAALQGRWRAEIAPGVAILEFTPYGNFTIQWAGAGSGRVEVDGDELTFSGSFRLSNNLVRGKNIDFSWPPGKDRIKIRRRPTPVGNDHDGRKFLPRPVE